MADKSAPIGCPRSLHPKDVPPAGAADPVLVPHLPLPAASPRRGVDPPVEPGHAPWRAIETSTDQQTPPRVDEHARGLPRAAIGAWVLAAIAAVVAFVVVVQPAPELVVNTVGVPDAGAAAQGGLEGGGPATGAPILVVEVAGAVAHPGVYQLPSGARIGDAISAAGGYAASVDALLADRELNLAAPVKDGEEVRVPVRGEASVTAPAASATGEASGTTAATAPGGMVDLNHATAAELDALPGVGPATAAKIIAAREQRLFGSVDELASRGVIGAATLEKLRARATVTP